MNKCVPLLGWPGMGESGGCHLLIGGGLCYVGENEVKSCPWICTVSLTRDRSAQGSRGPRSQLKGFGRSEFPSLAAAVTGGACPGWFCRTIRRKSVGLGLPLCWGAVSTDGEDAVSETSPRPRGHNSPEPGQSERETPRRDRRKARSPQLTGVPSLH